MWAQLCFPTRTKGKAYKSEAQGKDVINQSAARSQTRMVFLCLPLALGVPPTMPACAYTSASLLNLSQRHHAHTGNSKGICCSGGKRNTGSAGLGYRWCSPSTAQQIPSHQIPTLHRSTSNELRRDHPSRGAPELDCAPRNLQTSHLSCHVTMDNTKFHKAHVLVNVKAKAVLPAEAAQLQKDLAEIRARPTSLLSITHLKVDLLALEHTQEFLSRALPYTTANGWQWIRPSCISLSIAVLAAQSPGNTSLFPVTHIRHRAALQRART